MKDIDKKFDEDSMDLEKDPQGLGKDSEDLEKESEGLANEPEDLKKGHDDFKENHDDHVENHGSFGENLVDSEPHSHEPVLEDVESIEEDSTSEEAKHTEKASAQVASHTGEASYTEEVHEFKVPPRARSNYRLDESPEERYDRKIMKMRKKRRSRNLFSAIVLAVIAAVVIFVVGSYRKTQAPSVTPGSGEPSNAQASTSENGQGNLATSDDKSGDDASSDAGNKADPSYLYEGTAMPNANTGDVKQNSNGQGKNHNKASSVYAYTVSDVKNAMYHGGELGGGQKIAFLTYDDGLSPNSTPLLLDLLKKEGVPATFFCVGSTMVEKNKASIERIFHEGHALAFHSFDHSYKKLYPGRVASVDEIVKQFNMTQQALNKLFGFEIPISPWRYPGGHMSWKNMAPADKALENLNVHWIDWNAMSADAEGKRAPKTVQGQVDHIINDWKSYGSPKVITILMHDVPTKKLTREAVSEIVKALRNEGFSFGVLE